MVYFWVEINSLLQLTFFGCFYRIQSTKMFEFLETRMPGKRILYGQDVRLLQMICQQICLFGQKAPTSLGSGRSCLGGSLYFCGFIYYNQNQKL